MQDATLSASIQEVEACRVLMKTGTPAEFQALLGAVIPLWEAIRDSNKTSDEAQSYGARMLPLLKQVQKLVGQSVTSGKNDTGLDPSSRAALCESVESAIGFSAGIDDPDVLRARNDLTKRLLLLAQARQQVEKVPQVPSPTAPTGKKSKVPWIIGGIVVLGAASGLFFFLARRRSKRERPQAA